MSEYTVLAEISCAKISKELALEKACLFGCGVSTGTFCVNDTFCVALVLLVFVISSLTNANGFFSQPRFGSCVEHLQG